MKQQNIRIVEAADERQYMLNDQYEVYEKQGAPTGALALHYHNFYEIIYILEGEFTSQVGEKIFFLRKGDFLLIDRNVMHRYYEDERKVSSNRLIVWITEQMLSELSKELSLSDCFRHNGSQVYHFPVYYEEMLRGFLLKLAMKELIKGESAGNRLVLDRGYLSLLFGYLNELCKENQYSFGEQEVSRDPLVMEVDSYVEAHMERELHVQELADYVHLSKYYFLRRFKELTGLTVHGFVINKRLIRAGELISAGVSVAEAWQNSGFADYTSFLRNFRKMYGMSPREYAKLQEQR